MEEELTDKGFNFAQFYTVAPNLHLVVSPPQKFKVAIWEITGPDRLFCRVVPLDCC